VADFHDAGDTVERVAAAGTHGHEGKNRDITGIAMLIEVKELLSGGHGFMVVGDQIEKRIDDDELKVLKLIDTIFEAFEAEFRSRGDFIRVGLGGVEARADVIEQVFLGCYKQHRTWS